MINENFTLGPLQEEWVSTLEQHPERQWKGTLGRKYEDGSFKCCCLGHGALICGTAEWDKHNDLMDGGEYLRFHNYEKLGLIGAAGNLRTTVMIGDAKYSRLADMNDHGVTWPEIAAYIRANPTNVFTKSV